MSDVNCNVSDETLQYCKEFLEKYPEAPNWDKSFVEPLMISFIANKKKREKRKSHADYCKTYDKKRKLNSNTDIGHSSRNNTKQKREKLSAVERQRLCRLTLRRLMSYIYGAPILDVSRSHTTTQHSR